MPKRKALKAAMKGTPNTIVLEERMLRQLPCHPVMKKILRRSMKLTPREKQFILDSLNFADDEFLEIYTVDQAVELADSIKKKLSEPEEE